METTEAPRKALYTPRAQKIIEAAAKEAEKMGHAYTGSEHLLIALINDNGGAASTVLKSLNIDKDKVIAEVKKVVGI